MSSRAKPDIVSFASSKLEHYGALRVQWFGGELLLGLSTIEEISSGLIRLCDERQKPYLA
jgi:hypothetical protein